MMKLKFYISIFITLLTVSIYAQEAKLTTKVSRDILSFNENLKVAFSIKKIGRDHKRDSFTPPNFTNFIVIGEPTYSTKLAFVKGKLTYSQSHYYIIKPKKRGELYVGAASIKIDGKIIKSDPQKIIVLDSKEVIKDSKDKTIKKITNSLLDLTDEVFLIVNVSKEKIRIDENLKIVFSINKDAGDNFTPPDFKNFEVVGKPTNSVSFSNIKGITTYNKSYNYILKPKKKGELIIGIASIEIDDKVIKSKPIKIIVLDSVENKSKTLKKIGKLANSRNRR